ncbi:MAG: zinc metallopeptidase [Gemmatimonadetes bacterium]|nr:zinc metallopeptidase [Gemmatimonadota bacterium]
MRWTSGRRSTNVEDYRGRRMGGAGIKLGGAAIVIALLGWFFGVDPRLILGLMESTQTTQVEPPPPGGVQQTGHVSDALADFMSVVLADTEDTWTALFAQQGSRYVPPKLVLFDEVAQSACGRAGASVGPFYCPADRKVYIDLTFYRELKDRFQAPGDFAQAYVLAHEVGHHVQNLAGTSGQVREEQQRSSEGEANALSVRLELQADCYAGIWAHHADRSRQILETGDVDEALGAAAAVGDDAIQKRARGYVVPESFTHGSAEQRKRWFETGLTSGSLEACDTFGS